MNRSIAIGTAALLATSVLVAPGVSAVAAHAPAKPVVTRVASNYGATVGYTHVIIDGRHFTGTQKVTFGGTRAADVHVLSSHKLIAYAPGHHHGIVQVRVRTKAGTSPKSHKARYTYIHQVEPGSWHARLAPVPSGAPTDDFVDAVTSCPTVKMCYSVGIYGPAQDGIYNPPDDQAAEAGGALVSTRSSGRSTTQQIALPDGVLPGDTSIGFISCPAVGSCVAAGSTDGHSEGLLLVLADGTWTASKADLHQDGHAAVISGLSCAAAGECTATGYRINSSYDSSGPVLLRLHDGAWTTTDVTSPGGQSSHTDLTSIDCASASYCLAAGTYVGRTKRAGAFVVQVIDGSQTVRRIPNSPRDGRATAIDAVQCPAVGRCTVLGEFGVGLHPGTDFVSVENGSSFAFHPITLPADADQLYTLSAGYLPTMSCPAVSVCYATGEYQTEHTAQLPASVARLHGTKVHFYNLPRPAGKPGEDVSVLDIDCASTTACTAVGSADANSYNSSAAGAYFTFAGGVWTTEASQIAPGQKPRPTQTTYAAVDCPAAGACTANGDYHWDLKPDEESDGELLFMKASGIVSVES